MLGRQEPNIAGVERQLLDTRSEAKLYVFNKEDGHNIAQWAFKFDPYALLVGWGAMKQTNPIAHGDGDLKAPLNI